MISLLTVMSDTDLHTISWGLVGLVLLGCSSLDGLVHGMQKVEACGHSPDFGYRGETCELQLVPTTGGDTCEFVALGYSG
jgi:hypothetical protein